jgi:5-methylthioadenosine/S-adenosylhomocysteine deaminase
MSWLIEGGIVVTMADARGGVRPGASVAVEHDRIAAVGCREELRRRFPAAQLLDAGGSVVLPGLVNAHSHTDLQVLKGLAEGLDLHGWDADPQLLELLAELDRRDSVGLIEAALRAGYAQMARGGTTFVGEFSCADPAFPVAFEVLKEMGLSGALVTDKASPAGLGTPPDGFRFLAHLPEEEALTEEDLRTAEAEAASGNAWLTMHAAETRKRLELVQARFGLSTIRLLARHHLLSRRTILSHAVHVDAEEIRLIAESGAGVVASPAAEMKLADGISPLVAMAEAGIPLGLGTDCALCNNGVDLFAEMRTAGLLQKLASGPAAMGPAELLRMATLGGATLFGMEHELGSLEEGKRADLCLVDATGLAMRPLLAVGPRTNVLANLVFSATAADVTHTMARGRWVVADRRLVNQDEAQLAARLQYAAEHLFARVAERHETGD